ncbi:XRE family transcriptional regulator [Streptosporangiaceae bacterium NEAU-GS5]|nr:XRE family transcriptional regulator [Streptosporangiaceae bacterium NEAU-GS5]
MAANERLRAALLERGISVDALAAHLQVDPKTVQRWVTQGREPYPRLRYAAATYLGMDEDDLWPGANATRQASLSENEIVTVYPHRWTIPKDTWGRLFMSAEAEIGILAYSSTFLTDDGEFLRLLVDKARRGVRVRLLLGDPASPNVAQRGEDEGVGDGMAGRIKNALAALRPLRTVDGAELRLHGTVLYNSIYRADDQMLVNAYIYGSTAANSPVLHLRAMPGGDLVSTYLESFEKVWAGATPLDS